MSLNIFRNNEEEGKDKPPIINFVLRNPKLLNIKNIIYDRQIREAEHELEKLKELIVKSILIDHLNPILIDHPKLV